MIETGRLMLRGWEPRDRKSFAALVRDPEVMATLGPLLSREESDAMVERLAGIDAQHGHTFWAAERKADGTLIGFCGLVRGLPGTPIEGEPEIGWRLARAAWGQGYAREAAEASLAWAWATLPDPAVAAITAAVNARSRGLMERLGMVRDPAGEFDHPMVPDGSPLKRHVTYRIARPS